MGQRQGGLRACTAPAQHWRACGGVDQRQVRWPGLGNVGRGGRDARPTVGRSPVGPDIKCSGAHRSTLMGAASDRPVRWSELEAALMSRTSLVPVHGSQSTRRPAVEQLSYRRHQAVRDLRDSPTQDGCMFAVGLLRRDCLHPPLQVPCHKPVPSPARADPKALATGEAFTLPALHGTGGYDD